MNMKTITVSLLAVAFFVGCATRDEQCQRFTLIWREASATPIEEVPTPRGFSISPAEAVKPIMARSSRAPWAEFFLIVDANSYYFGNTRRGTELSCPEPDHWIIDGAAGKTTYIEKEDTEQTPGT
jgi:hypothetical protein